MDRGIVRDALGEVRFTDKLAAMIVWIGSAGWFDGSMVRWFAGIYCYGGIIDGLLYCI